MLGAAGGHLSQICRNGFADSIAMPGGIQRGNPREISNALMNQSDAAPDVLMHSDYLWAFGQFLDHDITLVENFNPKQNPEEFFPIVVPFNDKHFPPNTMIPMMRSKALEGTGTDISNPRRYENAISAFVDASAVYGSDVTRANWLRTFKEGKLKVSENNQLPWNTVDGLFNSKVDPNAPFMEQSGGLMKKFYIAGDIRANENPILITIHTIFVREHNRLCDEILEKNPNWADEFVYQKARKLVSGKMQRIAFEEWLPTMGVYLPKYNGYYENVDPSIFNVFSAAAFRMGHTLINNSLIRMDNNGKEMPSGNISLKDAFFNPLAINLGGGVEPYLKGMATQVQQDFDCKVIDDLRNFLFGAPGAGGLDLAAININRGRDRGLPDYNSIREDFGLPKVVEFKQICKDVEIVSLLEEVYGNVDNIDPWVGMLAEDHMPNSLFGELVVAILQRQFANLRDGDRFYYKNDASLTEADLAEIESTKMVDIVRNNTSIEIMQEDVFHAKPHRDINPGPLVEHVNLHATVYPNPVQNELHLKLWLDSEQQVEIIVYNDLGFSMYSQVVDLKYGKQSVVIGDVAHWPSGYYNMYVRSKDQFNLTRFLKL